MKSFLRVNRLAVTVAAVLLAGIALAATPALRLTGLRFGSGDLTAYVTAYGADNTGIADSTTAIQNAINAVSTAGGGTVVFPAGTYKSGLVTDPSANVPMEYVGLGEVVIASTASTFLKVNATGGRFTWRMRHFHFKPASGTAAMTPLLWLNGDSSGGIMQVVIDDVTFDGNGTSSSPQFFDCLWLYGVFDARISNVYGHSLYGSRGIVYDDNNVQSGNVHFDSISFADAAVNMMLVGRSSGWIDAQMTNIKAVRLADIEAAPYNESHSRPREMSATGRSRSAAPTRRSSATT
jgi:hypothetical protein